MKRIAAALLLSLATFGAVTLYALEGKEVVVLRTHANDGSTRATRVWVADDQGSTWIEAATDRRPFYLDLVADPELELIRDGIAQRRRASLLANPRGHERIRTLLRAKYGWADWWIGLLQDTTASHAVRLDLLTAPEPRQQAAQRHREEE